MLDQWSIEGYQVNSVFWGRDFM